MSCVQTYNITICSGVTSTFVFRAGGLPYIYKAITAITKTAPVSITSTSHGLVDKWPVAVVSPVGMDELQAKYSPPKGKDWHPASVSDVNTITLNEVNAADYTAYVSGGYLQYYTPLDLTGLQAIFTIYDVEGGTALYTFTSSPAAGVVLDNATKTVTVTLPSTQTYTISEGYYRLVLDYGSDVKKAIAEGTITIGG